MRRLLVLILAETALELVPYELWKHPSVLKHILYKGKKAGESLLDRSYHHAAMLKLKDSERRGRPDIAHFSLLEATSSPLYIRGSMDVYVHTVRDHAIHLGRSVRLPKTYFRFEGLVEKLFKEKKIVTPNNKVLLEMKNQSFKELISEIEPSIIMGLSRIGKKSTFEGVAKELVNYKRPALIVGGFPRGHFSQEISSNFDFIYSGHPLPLEVHVVIARIVYEFEKLVKIS
ncbi:MAG: ribosome biogenesis protein [Candidatus Methylarchaceae archaeon HK01M]|nr:ribosome biogenesis protein [Candidatus Methylarchaceae archaeon HK01M]